MLIHLQTFSIHHSTDLVLTMTELQKINLMGMHKHVCCHKEGLGVIPLDTVSLTVNEDYSLCWAMSILWLICLIGFLDVVQCQLTEWLHGIIMAKHKKMKIAVSKAESP